MIIFRKLVVAAVCGVLVTGCATSDPAVRADIDDIRQRIERNGSQETKDFHANIFDVAMAKKWPTAFALIGDDVTIHISAGLRKMLLNLAAISIVADASPREFDICRARYAANLFSQWFKPKFRGMSPRNVLNGYDADASVDPGDYFAELKGLCKKYA